MVSSPAVDIGCSCGLVDGHTKLCAGVAGRSAAPVPDCGTCRQSVAGVRRTAAAGGAGGVREGDRGRITLRATRLTSPLSLDGALDEAVYQEVSAIDHFFQQEPDEGAAATEKTLVVAVLRRR